MQGHIDETEYIKNQAEDENIDDSNPENKDQILRIVKNQVFQLFFKLNITKSIVGVHYYIIMIIIEALQLLTFVLNDGSYTTAGPYEDKSP